MEKIKRVVDETGRKNEKDSHICRKVNEEREFKGDEEVVGLRGRRSRGFPSFFW